MNNGHQKTGIPFFQWFGVACLVIFISSSISGSDQSLEEWITQQLKARDVEFISLIDHRPWLTAPEPSVHIILGIGKRAAPDATLFTFAYVLLVQSSDPHDIKYPKLLAAYIPENSVTGHLSSMLAVPGQAANGPVSVDVGPYPLQDKQYAFGIRYRVSAVGNKGGNAYEILGLFRYRNGELKEVLRDVVWAYSKYVSNDNSCNSEMALVPKTGKTGGKFNYVRSHVRSYYGESRWDPEWTRLARIADRPISSCAAFQKLETTNTHRWNDQKGLYLDSTGEKSGHLLWWDSLFK